MWPAAAWTIRPTATTAARSAVGKTQQAEKAAAQRRCNANTAGMLACRTPTFAEGAASSDDQFPVAHRVAPFMQWIQSSAGSVGNFDRRPRKPPPIQSQAESC